MRKNAVAGTDLSFSAWQCALMALSIQDSSLESKMIISAGTSSTSMLAKESKITGDSSVVKGTDRQGKIREGGYPLIRMEVICKGGTAVDKQTKQIHERRDYSQIKLGLTQ